MHFQGLFGGVGNAGAAAQVSLYLSNCDAGETKNKNKNTKKLKNMGDSNSLSRISPTNGSLALLRISHNAKGSCGVSGSRRSIIEMV